MLQENGNYVERTIDAIFMIENSSNGSNARWLSKMEDWFCVPPQPVRRFCVTYLLSAPRRSCKARSKGIPFTHYVLTSMIKLNWLFTCSGNQGGPRSTNLIVIREDDEPLRGTKCKLPKDFLRVSESIGHETILRWTLYKKLFPSNYWL